MRRWHGRRQEPWMQRRGCGYVGSRRDISGTWRHFLGLHYGHIDTRTGRLRPTGTGTTQWYRYTDSLRALIKAVVHCKCVCKWYIKILVDLFKITTQLVAGAFVPTDARLRLTPIAKSIMGSWPREATQASHDDDPMNRASDLCLWAAVGSLVCATVVL